MANPYEFLKSWLGENAHATAFRDKAEAKRLDHEIRKAAKEAGVSWFGIIKAAGGDLEGYILAELDRAADQKVERLVAKDKLYERLLAKDKR